MQEFIRNRSYQLFNRRLRYVVSPLAYRGTATRISRTWITFHKQQMTICKRYCALEANVSCQCFVVPFAM